MRTALQTIPATNVSGGILFSKRKRNLKRLPSKQFVWSLSGILVDKIILLCLSIYPLDKIISSKKCFTLSISRAEKIFLESEKMFCSLENVSLSRKVCPKFFHSHNLSRQEKVKVGKDCLLAGEEPIDCVSKKFHWLGRANEIRLTHLHI